MAAILRFETVGARVSRAAEILSDLHFALDAGEVALVAGLRGAGKSMLAELAALRRRPDRGRIRLLGRDTGEASPGEIARLRRRVGHAAELPELITDVAPADEVAVPLRLAGRPARAARADAAELLDWLGLAEPLKRPWGPLPPPDRMRIALSRALVHRPALAVLDEPMRLLDARSAERLGTLIDRLSRDGTAFIVTGPEETGMLLPPGATRLRLRLGRLEVVDRPRLHAVGEGGR